MKIVLIGAGSREFGPATVRDVLLSDRLCAERPTVTLMDVVPEALEACHRYCTELALRLGRTVSFEMSTELETALIGADYVVMAIESKRYFYWAQDFHIPRKYGFKQIYGENGGPGGLFHALRNMGPSVDAARAIEASCPDAWLLNYTNPLTKLCEAQTRLSNAKVIGLCHGVFHGKEQVCRFLDIPMEELDALACGLNHFTWFQSIKSRSTGDDLYPRLRDRERSAHWLSDWDEIALSRILFRTFGLFPSPGTNHIGEYIGWADEWYGTPPMQFFYDPRDGHPWESGKVPTWLYNLSDHPTDVPTFPKGELTTLNPNKHQPLDPSGPIEPSGELAIPIIEGLACGVENDLAAINVPNDGYIPNLPARAVVEVPATAGPRGVIPRSMTALPEPVAAMLRVQTSINKMLVDAFAESSRDKLLQALLLDPTAHSYRAAVNLLNEMFTLQEAALPPLTWSEDRSAATAGA